ncbi:MAG: outer membrane lipoprotein carrier protein LolA [Bacteroidales bacterium]|nr:outer membrane lipoprotein carrier protein LolA [Bacteroidales bacterium]
MKKILFISIILLAGISLFAQETEFSNYDPEAKKILDKLSDKLAEKNTARIYFEYSAHNAQDSTEYSYMGYLFVKDESKYKVIIPENEIFSDGVKVFSYNKKANEMNITFSDPKNDAIYTPQNLINAYKKGYKYSYRGELTFEPKARVNGEIVKVTKTCHVIDLYPENPKKSPYSIIRIWIDKDKNELVSVKYQEKDGVEQVVDILSFELDITINDDIFTFDPKLYPENIDVIDFTEE